MNGEIQLRVFYKDEQRWSDWFDQSTMAVYSDVSTVQARVKPVFKFVPGWYQSKQFPNEVHKFEVMPATYENEFQEMWTRVQVLPVDE